MFTVQDTEVINASKSKEAWDFLQDPSRHMDSSCEKLIGILSLAGVRNASDLQYCTATTVRAILSCLCEVQVMRFKEQFIYDKASSIATTRNVLLVAGLSAVAIFCISFFFSRRKN